jgi:small subunit ribosomal protein S2
MSIKNNKKFNTRALTCRASLPLRAKMKRGVGKRNLQSSLRSACYSERSLANSASSQIFSYSKGLYLNTNVSRNTVGSRAQQAALSILSQSTIVNKRILRRRKKLIQEVRNQILKKILGFTFQKGDQKALSKNNTHTRLLNTESIKNQDNLLLEKTNVGIVEASATSLNQANKPRARESGPSTSLLPFASSKKESIKNQDNLFLEKTNDKVDKVSAIPLNKVSLEKQAKTLDAIGSDQSTSLLPFYKKMISNSMHYGQKVVQCHPSMKKYTRGQFNGRHLINLMRTLRYFKKALWFLTKYAYQKKTILFVGTNIASSYYVEKAAVLTKSYFVNVRWLGGMLTNWKTIKKLISKLKKEIKEQQKRSFLDLPKKEIAKRKKEKQRLDKYLRGMKMAKRFPQVVIMTSIPSNISAAFECQKLGIFNISIVDTNCQKDLADIIIPSNDDSPTSIRFILSYLSRAILAGKVLWNLKKKVQKLLFGKERFSLKIWKKKLLKVKNMKVLNVTKKKKFV